MTRAVTGARPKSTHHVRPWPTKSSVDIPTRPRNDGLLAAEWTLRVGIFPSLACLLYVSHLSAVAPGLLLIPEQ